MTNFVNVNEMESVEQYASSLPLAIFSLKTLEAYQLKAIKMGIFSSDEEETAKTIVWEIRRTISLYQTQIDGLFERMQIDPEIVMNALKEHVGMPIKKPRKPRAKKK